MDSKDNIRTVDKMDKSAASIQHNSKSSGDALLESNDTISDQLQFTEGAEHSENRTVVEKNNINSEENIRQDISRKIAAELYRLKLKISNEEDGLAIQAIQMETQFQKVNFRKGPISLQEDLVLLITMVHLRDYFKGLRLQHEYKYNLKQSLKYFMPWRKPTVWVNRYAEIFYKNWSVDWTFEEDMKLLTLAKQYSKMIPVDQRDPKYFWSSVACNFAPYRKAVDCSTRFQTFLKDVGPGRKFSSLKHFHDDLHGGCYKYAMSPEFNEIWMTTFEMSAKQCSLSYPNSLLPLDTKEKLWNSQIKIPSDEELYMFLSSFDSHKLAYMILYYRQIIPPGNYEAFKNMEDRDGIIIKKPELVYSMVNKAPNMNCNWKAFEEIPFPCTAIKLKIYTLSDPKIQERPVVRFIEIYEDERIITNTDTIVEDSHCDKNIGEDQNDEEGQGKDTECNTHDPDEQIK